MIRVAQLRSVVKNFGLLDTSKQLKINQQKCLHLQRSIGTKMQ